MGLRLSGTFVVFILLFIPAIAHTAEFEALAADGIDFLQLDFPENDPPEPDSGVGLLRVNLLSLRAGSGIATGYVNVVVDDTWVVRNMLVPLERDYPYSHLATRFDLGVASGTDVGSIDAHVRYSDAVLTAAPAGAAAPFTVGAEDVVQSGLQDASGVRGAGGPSGKPNLNDVLFGDPANTRAIFQLDHPNLEAAQNQCYPMAIANSLQFLADTTDLELPHSHVPGLRGDNSLVGQLDTLMNRSAPSRRSGSAVDDLVGIDGKLKYLVNNNLHKRVETRHWGKFSGDSSRVFSASGKTATSVAGGLALPFGEMINSLERGENCEAGYSFPGGGHAIDIAAAGITNGVPWIIESSDTNQSSDSKGAGPQGFLFSHLVDTDKDGYANMNGGSQELDLLICQRYIPPPAEDGTFLPPPTGSFTIPDAAVGIQLTTDPGGHSCCVQPPPSAVDLEFSDGRLLLSDSVSWLPFDSAIEGANFTGSSNATVAGFSNVTNTIEGMIMQDSLSAVIALGTEGELPGGQPISWNVSITPDGPWPWLEPGPANTGLKPRLRVNGFRSLLMVEPGAPLSVNVSLGADGDQSPADWFLTVQTAKGVSYSWNMQTGWGQGVFPAYQGPLRDLGNTPLVKQMTGLPPGDYTFYFMVDTTPNGQLDENTAVSDALTLVVQ